MERFDGDTVYSKNTEREEAVKIEAADLSEDERALWSAINERWRDGVISTASAKRLAKMLEWTEVQVRTVAASLAVRKLLAFSHDAAWPVSTGEKSFAFGSDAVSTPYEFTLSYFTGKVREIAAGRKFSTTLTTTETAQSDGAGMRVLMWHAWIDGHRSAIDTDMCRALEWLQNGDIAKAGLSGDVGVVTESGWSVGRAPNAEPPHWTRGHAEMGHTTMAYAPAEATCTPSGSHRLEPCPLTAAQTPILPGTSAWYYDDDRRRVPGVVTLDEGLTGKIHLKVGEEERVFDKHERYRVLVDRTQFTVTRGEAPLTPPYAALRLVCHADGSFWSAITQETGALEAHNIGECAFATTPDAIEELALRLLTMSRARRAGLGGSP